MIQMDLEINRMDSEINRMDLEINRTKGNVKGSLLERRKKITEIRL
jgi:hypothetical protein